MKVELFAPPDYWRLLKESPEVIEALVNGCGPQGWKVDLVPDTIYGLDISPICNIHDYMFAVGKTYEDMVVANDVFKNNLKRWIDAHTKWRWLRKLRLKRAEKYVRAVETWGGPSFWKDKNRPEEVQKVPTMGGLILQNQVNIDA